MPYELPIAYTKGACTNNGNEYAKASYGVYWECNYGMNDLGKPLRGNRQTHNRAELTAANAAIQQAKAKGFYGVKIRTISQYVHNIFELMWEWEENNWCKSNGQPVANLDLVKTFYALTKYIEVHIEPVHDISYDRAAYRKAREGYAQ